MKHLQRMWVKFTAKVSRFSSKIHAPWARKLIGAKDYRILKSKLRSGDVLVSRVRGEFSNLGIPGFFTHAAIAFDESSVIESTTHGVVKTDLIDFVMKKDFIVVLRPIFLDTRGRYLAAFKAQSQIGKPYDFEFSLSDIKAFYCSELVGYAYQQVDEHKLFTCRMVMGRETILPQDFVDAKDKFLEIWRSESLIKRV